MARANYLTVAQFYTLNHACKLLTKAFGQRTYLVGSCLERANYRDVDLRCILDDETFDFFFTSADNASGSARCKLMGVAMSEYLAKLTGLPIDFQFQRRTDANEEFDTAARHAIGMVLTGE